MIYSGAGNEIRTRDPDLGKVVLYQLSYSRLHGWCSEHSGLTAHGLADNNRHPDEPDILMRLPLESST